MTESRNKLVVLGLDGATFDIIGPMARKGDLPNISRLLQSGTSGKLDSTIPPLTPPAWTTFATGKNPGRHGVFDFLAKPYSTHSTISFTNFNSVKCATFWEILEDTGLKFCVVNLPMTYPPSPLNGIIISGMDTPNERATFTYPEGLFEELRKHGIHYQVRFLPRGRRRPKEPDQLLDQFFRVEREHKDTFLYLLQKKSWNVFVGVFMLLDKVQHFFWHSCAGLEHRAHDRFNEIEEAYKLIDGFIGEILSVVEPDSHVMLLSDHGFGKYQRIFFINEWLRREGLLTLKKSNGLTSYRRIKFRQVEKTGAQILERLGLGRLGKILPQRSMQTRYRLYLPRFNHSASEVDWSKTKAYGATYGIYINLKERTPNGIVSPEAEYEQIRNMIQNRLRHLTDPATGEAINLTTFRKEEVYSGPYVGEAPDLVFDFKNNEALPSHAFNFGKVSVRRNNFGTHRYEGIFLLQGPGVKKNHRLNGSHIVDIAPTMFHLLGQPVPNDFDGKVIADAFLQDYLDSHPVNFQPSVELALNRKDDQDTYTPEEASEIAEKLRNLGYLD